VARVRDYAAEYARRKALHPEDITKARGHTSREYESVERALRLRMKQTNVRVDRNGNIIRRAYESGNKPSTRGLQKRYGTENLRRQLEIAKEAEKLYESGQRDRARLVWMQRDQSLPEWIFWYHGVFG